MKKYSIVEDSHYRSFLKEEGYGFVAHVIHYMTPDRFPGVELTPMNKGVDMSPQELRSAFEAARGAKP